MALVLENGVWKLQADSGGATAPSVSPDLATNIADAISSPPSNATWLNGGNLTSAAVASNQLDAVHGTTNTNFHTLRNAPFLYYRVERDPYYPTVITARVRSNADASAEIAGLAITEDADAYSTDFVSVGCRGGDTNFLSRGKGAFHQWSSGVDPAATTWFRFILEQDLVRVCAVQSGDASPPTTGWVFDQSLYKDFGTSLGQLLSTNTLRCGFWIASGNTSGNFEAALSYLDISGCRLL